MLRRVAPFGWCLAACIVIWPARSGVDRGTLDEFRAAAAAPIAEATVKGDAGAQLDPRQDAQLDPRQDAQRAALEPAAPAPPAPPSPPPAVEPFGLAAATVPGGDLASKWIGVEAQIRAEAAILARCRDDAAACPAAARRFLAVIAQGRAASGRARIGAINRAVNLAIAPMSDLKQWGVPDRWSPPLETFATGRGDCEDYAIAKYVALTAAGFAAADVKLVVVRNLAADEDHAVTAVRLDGDWVVLDNRWLTLVRDLDMPKVMPLFVLDDQGVRRFATPAVAARQAAAPASF